MNKFKINKSSNPSFLKEFFYELINENYYIILRFHSSNN